MTDVFREGAEDRTRGACAPHSKGRILPDSIGNWYETAILIPSFPPIERLWVLQKRFKISPGNPESPDGPTTLPPMRR